jgi:hypothetical protein
VKALHRYVTHAFTMPWPKAMLNKRILAVLIGRDAVTSTIAL